MHKPEITEVRSQAAYPIAEASRYLKVAPATLRSWLVGRRYPKADGIGVFRPLIQPANKQPTLLSFWNLIEAHVLRALRTEHGVSIQDVRKALNYAEQSLDVDHLLLRNELCTSGGNLFLEKYGKLINLSASGQLAMRKVFDAHLKRVDWDNWKFPVRLYPFLSTDTRTAERPIAIDPSIAFGRPVIIRKGVTTGTIAERIDAGETISDIAADYSLEESEIEQAILYERAA